jgi:hypothetical protein
VETRRLNAHLWDRWRIITAPIVRDDYQGVRVTPNIYTPLEEIDTFSTALEEVARKGLPAAVPGAVA